MNDIGPSDPRPAQLAAAAARLSIVLGVAGMVLLTGWPSTPLPRLFVWIAIILALLFAGIETTVRMGKGPHRNLAALPTRELLAGWISGNALVTDEHQLEIFRQVFYDGRNARARWVRYLLLMAFASLIATAGVIGDSTAVVIGAMLIAPLITPMMGMALSLTMGWEKKLIRSTGLVATGISIAVGTGAFVSLVLTAAINVETNSQIASRTSPTLVDLVVAIAAGAAGAYAIARPDVSSSLPGVAIAIALVPPLCVLGVTLQQREFEFAAGVTLLFATNLLAIIVTGGFVFLLTGVAPLERLNDGQHRLRVGIASIGVVSMLVIIALAANGREITENSLDTDIAAAATIGWLGDDAAFTLNTTSVEDDVVTVVLVGSGEPPSAEVLARSLSSRLGRPVTLDLQWIPRNRILIPAAD